MTNHHASESILLTPGWGVGTWGSPDYQIYMGTQSWTIAPGQSVTAVIERTFDTTLPVGGGYTYSFVGGGTPAWGVDFSTSGYSVGPCGGSIGGVIVDGRANGGDLAAPAAVYCEPAGGLDIWDIDADGNGTPGIVIAQEEIDAALAEAAASGQNVLIAQWGDKSLYALSSGELTLVGYDLKEPGKVYQTLLGSGTCG
jgi:hypothetical protein